MFKKKKGLFVMGILIILFVVACGPAPEGEYPSCTVGSYCRTVSTACGVVVYTSWQGELPDHCKASSESSEEVTSTAEAIVQVETQKSPPSKFGGALGVTIVLGLIVVIVVYQRRHGG